MNEYLGIDIGGTKLAVCRGRADGTITASHRFPTADTPEPRSACDRLAESLLAIAADLDPETPVGVSAPGPLSSAEGCLLNPPNMPLWHDFDLRSALEVRLARPVAIMNDANAAAAAEWRWGAGRGTQTMVFFTMSTGMGAGLVVGGRLHQGASELAGEVGHTRVAPDGPVGFGRRGSLEGFCSGPGIRQLAVAHLHQARHGNQPSLLFRDDRDYRLVDMPEIGSAARAGDAVALEVFEEVGRRLGDYCSGLVDLLNPDAIVVGTIGRLFAEFILPTTRRVIDESVHPRAARQVQLLPAALGDATGDLASIAVALFATGQLDQ
ncbi:MAG: ROK family protein [Planctomycetes bacterium]|nr:ROK family protein [Planctomycetota bacterium]